MDLVLFDLDHTLLDGDSDLAWGQFLGEIGAVDADYKKRSKDFYVAYRRGELDMTEFIRFALQPLTHNDMRQLLDWRQRFLVEKIEPMVNSEALAFVRRHQSKGDFTAIITSTNSFISEPIGKLVGIETVIATQGEIIDGRYTGGLVGVPCFREGKIDHLEKWLAKRSLDYQQSWFYSDSFNDVPLLSWVDMAVAVNSDATLHEHAVQNGWFILSLHTRS